MPPTPNSATSEAEKAQELKKVQQKLKSFSEKVFSTIQKQRAGQEQLAQDIKKRQETIDSTFKSLHKEFVALRAGVEPSEKAAIEVDLAAVKTNAKVPFETQRTLVNTQVNPGQQPPPIDFNLLFESDSLPTNASPVDKDFIRNARMNWMGQNASVLQMVRRKA